MSFETSNFNDTTYDRRNCKIQNFWIFFFDGHDDIHVNGHPPPNFGKCRPKRPWACI